jgi:hypothetical protein
MLRLVTIAATALVAAASAATAETLVERGDYLVNAVMACDGCHTPRTAAGFVMEKRFSGGSQVWDEAAYTVRGPNITPDRETGIGTWKDADLKRALVEGVRPSGVPLVPQMPFPFYRILTMPMRWSPISAPPRRYSMRCRRPSTRPRFRCRSFPAPRGRSARTR